MGADLFSTKKSKMASGSLFFTESAILPIFDPILQQEGKKNLEFSYTTHITRTTRVWQVIWGSDLFNIKKSKMASGSLFFTKSAILPIFDPILILQWEGKKNWNSDIPPISQDPHGCGKLSEV